MAAASVDRPTSPLRTGSDNAGSPERHSGSDASARRAASRLPDSCMTEQISILRPTGISRLIDLVETRLNPHACPPKNSRHCAKWQRGSCSKSIRPSTRRLIQIGYSTDRLGSLMLTHTGQLRLARGRYGPMASKRLNHSCRVQITLSIRLSDPGRGKRRDSMAHATAGHPLRFAMATEASG